MQTLAFLRQKGGSGKTTLAVHTAVAAQEAGERVVIVDTDLQKSATTWSDARQSDTPAVAPVAAAALPDVIKASRHDAITLPDYALFSADKAWYKTGTHGCFLRV